MIVNLTDAALKAGRASGDGRVWAISTLLKSFTDLVKAKVGDTLHQFEDRPDAELAAQKTLWGTMKDFNLPDQRRDMFEPQPISAGITPQDLSEYEAFYEVLSKELGTPRKKFYPPPRLQPIANAPGDRLKKGDSALGSGALADTHTEPEQLLKNNKPVEAHQQKIASIGNKNRVTNGYVEKKALFKDSVQPDSVKATE